MKFTEVAVDENFPIRKFESENSVWEWGLTPMMFGVRIRAGMVGEMVCELDYCAGADPAEQTYWLGFISGLMSQLPEIITPDGINYLFPRQTIKPLSLDKECQKKFFELARMLERAKIGHL